MSTPTTSTRGLLRWVGGKRSVVDQLEELMPPVFGTYFEPFLGSAQLLLKQTLGPFVVGDINAELTHFYGQLAEDWEPVHRVAYGWSRDEDTYYRVRAQSPAELDDVVRAARFFFLNRLAFNGLYRTNRAGVFNVPFGVRTGAFPSVDDWLEASRRFGEATIHHADYEVTAATARAGDFVYADPPFFVSEVGRHGVYGYDSHREADVGRLGDWLRDLDRRRVFVAVSHTEFGALQEQLEGWRSVPLKGRNNVSAKPAGRNTRSEVVLLNY